MELTRGERDLSGPNVIQQPTEFNGLSGKLWTGPYGRAVCSRCKVTTAELWNTFFAEVCRFRPRDVSPTDAGENQEAFNRDF